MEKIESGFFGFNPAKAKNNIDNFNNQVQHAYNSLFSAVNILFIQLHDNWYSDKAVDFYNKLTNSVNEINGEIVSNVSKINSDVCDAYNSIALANGLETIWVTPYLNMKNNYPELLRANVNGDIGMNTSAVKEIIQNFEKRMRDVINEFNSLPTSIALYDDENGIQQYYSTNVKELGSLVESFISSLISEVNNNINNEIDLTINSKNKSVEILRQ
jgi:hypothetical protein